MSWWILLGALGIGAWLLWSAFRSGVATERDAESRAELKAIDEANEIRREVDRADIGAVRERLRKWRRPVSPGPTSLDQ